jgi:hypothetical protein
MIANHTLEKEPQSNGYWELIKYAHQCKVITDEQLRELIGLVETKLP